MISILLQNYLTILIAIGVSSLAIFAFGLYWIVKSSRANRDFPHRSGADIHAIAGDDVLSTQLDLARAFIEIDKKPLAKKILQEVSSRGSALQQEEAQRLLGYL